MLLLVLSFLVLSGFTFPTKTRDIFNKYDADETAINLSEAFGGLDEWVFDKEKKAWMNSGFEIYLNDDLTEIDHITLKGLSIEATYGLMDGMGISPTSITRYILENDTELMSDQYIEDDYMLTVLTLRPFSTSVTVGIYYEESKIQEILDTHYNFITDETPTYDGLK